MLSRLINALNRKAAVLVREWRIAFGPTPLELVRQYDDACHRYHHWYYDNAVHNKTTFCGRPTMKSVSDMWNYQEIIWDIKPSLVIEFGTLFGGSALYFRTILEHVRDRYLVLSVDVDHSNVDDDIRRDPRIELLNAASSAPSVKKRILELRNKYPGRAFFILDSDHSKQNVLAELRLLREITSSGDYIIVEDSNINGHPVVPGWGVGPFEAVTEYLSEFPNEYKRDLVRESKFGFTYAPNGFLIRK